MLCDSLDGWNGGGGRQAHGDVCVLIHTVVWQKPTQHCKAITLQLKKKEVVKKKSLIVQTVLEVY